MPTINPLDFLDWDQEFDPASLQSSKQRFESSENITEEDLLICSPTVPGFCFRDKYWGKDWSGSQQRFANSSIMQGNLRSWISMTLTGRARFSTS
jgi:hypothetical protein